MLQLCAFLVRPGFAGDEDINTRDTSTRTPAPTSPTPLGSISHARARQLNNKISSFFSSCPLYLDNGNACTLVWLRNDGEDKKGRGFAWTRFA